MLSLPAKASLPAATVHRATTGPSQSRPTAPWRHQPGICRAVLGKCRSATVPRPNPGTDRSGRGEPPKTEALGSEGGTQRNRARPSLFSAEHEASAKTRYRLEDRSPASTSAGTFKSATTTTAKKMRFPVFFIWIQLLRHPDSLGDNHRDA